MLALDHAGNNEIISIEIFPLKYADAVSLAAMVNGLFAADKSVVARSPRPGSFVFGQKVFAKADEHGNSMIVTAPEDMMPIIRDLVMKLDEPVEDITEVKMFKLKNADCTEMAKMLASLFPDPNSTGASPRPANFNSGRGPAPAQAAGTTPAESEYMKKLATVIAVPDPRTQSLLVSASKDLMPQIEDMINSLDAEATSPLARSNPPAMQDIIKDVFPSNVPNNFPNNGVETDGPGRSATGF